MPDLGDVMALGVEIRNSAGVLANATFMSLAIALPDGTTTSPTPSNPSPGVYIYDYLTSQVGHHRVTWTATGLNAGSYQDSFDVGSPWLGIISLAEARAQLDVSATTDDEQLRWYIEACSKAVEGIVGPCVPRTFTEINRSFDGSIMLRRTPALSVTSATALAPGTTSYVTADLVLDGDLGLVTLATGGCIPYGRYTTVYRAGRTDIPPNIRLATNLVVQHNWRAWKGMGSETFGPGGPAPMPLEAKILLADEKQPMLA